MLPKFNFNARQVFLTYPKSTLSKNSILEKLKQVAEVKDYSISKETHKDGTPHLHAVIRFETKVHTRSERTFDVEGYHPHIKILKTSADFLRAQNYTEKDGDYISNIVKKIGAKEQLAKDLIEAGLTSDFVRSHPSLIFTNFNSVRSWLFFLNPPLSRPISTQKKRHIWLHGPSNSGKTTWLRAFRSLYVSYEIPENNDFTHVSQDAEALYVDEYRGFLTIQQLNRIADGDTNLNTKGGSVKIGFLIVVVVSNFSVRDVYKNVSDSILDTVYNRFHEYDSSISLPKFPVMKI